MPENIKLRGQFERRNAPHPLGELPHSLAIGIGKQIVHRLAVGNSDITGDDFGGIFAQAISGDHRASPLGVADVIWNGCAWSVKTVKDSNPFERQIIRAISGRNSPIFSSGISDPLYNIEATGASVLNIWNARVNESLNHHDDLRIFIFVRNLSSLEFMMFEIEAPRYTPANFRWELNRRGNLQGYDRETGNHVFTWQPHGSQFTVLHRVPHSAYRFRITRNPGTIEEHHVLQLIQYNDDWIEAVSL